MAIQRVHQSTFHRGEIDEKLISRVDLQAYGQALKKCRNAVPLNQGGLERRPGTLWLADLGEITRLESFIFSDDQKYIFAFQNTKLKVYSTAGSLLQTISSCRWTTAQLFELTMAQQGDVMIVCHKDMEYHTITRTGATTFALGDFDDKYKDSQNGKRTYKPYQKSAAYNVTLDIDSTTAGTGKTLTTSAAHWTSDYVGTTVRYHGFECEITGYTSSTVVTATLRENIAIELEDDPLESQEATSVIKVLFFDHGLSVGDSITIEGAEDIFDGSGNGHTAASLSITTTVTEVIDDDHFTYTVSTVGKVTAAGGGVRVIIKTHAPTTNWDEQMYSDPLGYPSAVTFHENRLYFGGGDTFPDFINASKAGDFFNFDVGQANDGDAVQVQIASNEIHQIRHIVSEKNLQIFTNTAEFYLKQQISKPVTPTDISIVKESTSGSNTKARPHVFDGATIFVQDNGRNVREFVYNQSTEILEANNISIESASLIRNPKDTAGLHSQETRVEQFFGLVNDDDGTLAIYSAQRDQKIFGWTLYETTGEFLSIASSHDYFYVVTKRTVDSTDIYSLEQIALNCFDLPTDYTISKTISGSYQPHGSPAVNGAITTASTLIVDGFTANVTPSAGETFQFGGTGTVFTINSVVATANPNEYTITIDSNTTQADNATLVFVTSKTFSGLDSSPDMTGLTVHATSGSTETDNYFYYGSGTVDSNGLVTFPNATSACDIGIDYTVDVETLPQDANIASGQLTGYPRKIGKSIIELHNSFNLQVNTLDVLLQNTVQDDSTGMDKFTGKKELHTLGYSTEPFLTITQSVPLPFRILGITTEVYY
ncbi:MAG: hypothetical protein VW235_10040 [Rhodospirillaceae bacterium]